MATDKTYWCDGKEQAENKLKPIAHPFVHIRYAWPDRAVHKHGHSAQDSIKDNQTNQQLVRDIAVHAITFRLHLHAQYQPVHLPVHDVPVHDDQHGDASYQCAQQGGCYQE